MGVGLSASGGVVETNEMVFDCVNSISKVDFNTLTCEDVKRSEFVDLNVAYCFHNSYGKIIGFGTQKHKVGRNVKGDILW